MLTQTLQQKTKSNLTQLQSWSRQYLTDVICDFVIQMTAKAALSHGANKQKVHNMTTACLNKKRATFIF